MTTGLREYREIQGFDVFDRAEARQALDERAGARVKALGGALLLNRPAFAALSEVSGGAVHRRGVLLAFKEQTREMAIAAAPSSCPEEKRQDVVSRGVMTAGRAHDRARRLLSAEWPALVRAQEFFALHGLARTSLGGDGLPAKLVDGMLVVDTAALGRVSRRG